MPYSMNAQKEKLVLTPISLGDIEITIMNTNTIGKAYQWLVKKSVFAVDPGPIGPVTPACKLEFIGDAYKYKTLYVYIRNPESILKGALTGVELFDLYDLLGMNVVTRYFTRPENLKESPQKGKTKPKGAD